MERSDQVVEEVAGHLTVIADAKSVSSLRTITAPPFLIGGLANHLAEHRGDSKDDRDAVVFVGPRGGVLRRRFGERILRPAVAAAKLPASLTFPGLRHVAISALANEDVHPTTMQHRAGHATTKLTLGLYSHVTDASDRAAADALEARFRPAFSAGSGTGVARQTPEDTTETA